ncbi:MAG TPA: acylneuraminate cytidylyltransferase family protein [Bryobacteraceae bacterium]|nr:acylneuraminate cytidylyltransferase family protein [Bryobacteraceae bacterium]
MSEPTDPPAGAIAVIPARGGSKRIPRKNVRELCGRPMLLYTIEAALHSGLFARVVVSTDDPEIAALAERSGAEAPFLRDGPLADDYTPVSLVTLDAILRLDRDDSLYDSVAQLMPNCPLRTADDILESWRQFQSTAAKSQISIVRFSFQNPWWAIERDERFHLTPLFGSHITARSQDLPELFCPTGAVWWSRTSNLRQAKTFHTPDRTGWEIPWERSIDIDTSDDWRLAELIMQSAPARAANA